MNTPWKLSCRFQWLKLAIPVLIALYIIIGGNALASPNPVETELRTLIETARDAWVRQDAQALAQLFTPDGQLIVPGQRWQGREEIRRAVSRFAQDYSNVKIDIRQVIIEGNRAAVEWSYEDVEIATGKRNKADDAIIIEVRDGHISYWREYFDTPPPS